MTELLASPSAVAPAGAAQTRADAAPVNGAPTPQGSTSPEGVADEIVVEHLVEDISIDGMCGVY